LGVRENKRNKGFCCGFRRMKRHVRKREVCGFEDKL
jgi:hypothetical protein